MKNALLVAAGVAVAVAGAVVWLQAAVPTIGPTAATPAYIVVNTPTPVVITAQITDTTLIAGSVNLLKVDAAGKTLATIGVMRDDGLNGDLKAGDRIFGLATTIDPSDSGFIRFKVSAAFRGILRRLLSPSLSVEIVNTAGYSVGATAANSQLIVVGSVTAARSYYDSNRHDVFTHVQLQPSQIIRGDASTTSTIAVEIRGGTLNGITAAGGGPTFRTGEAVLVLLTGPDHNGHYSVVDGSFGKFTVLQNTTLGPVAVIDPAYAAADRLHGYSPTYQSIVTRSEQQLLPLSELVAILHTLPE
jgi:hypothetical protein